MPLYRWKEIEETPATQTRMKFKRKVIRGQNMVLQRILNHEGQDGQCHYAPHAHPEEQILINLEKRKQIRVGEEWFTLEPGDVLVIPPDTPHEATSEVGNLFLDIKTLIPGHHWRDGNWAPGAEEDWKKVKALLEKMERKYHP